MQSKFALHIPSYSFEIKQPDVSSDVILFSSYLKSVVTNPAVVGHNSKFITWLPNAYLEWCIKLIICKQGNTSASTSVAVEITTCKISTLYKIHNQIHSHAPLNDFSSVNTFCTWINIFIMLLGGIYPLYAMSKFLAKITSVIPSLQSVQLWEYDPTLLTYCISLGHDTLPLQLQSCTSYSKMYWQWK